MDQCPICDQKVKDGAKECPSCGAALTTEETMAQAAGPVPETPQAGQEAAVEPDEAARKTTAKGCLVILIVLAVLVAVALVYTLMQK